MDESTIVWKEAKSHSRQTSEARESSNQDDVSSEEAISSHQEGQSSNSKQDDLEEETDSWGDPEETVNEYILTRSRDHTERLNDNTSIPIQDFGTATKRIFSYQKIDLKLRRDITAIADPAQHKPRLNYSANGAELPLDQWVENALIAISPSADIILFSGQSPEKLVFLAKLRIEPIIQYTTRKLNIPIDYDEHVTSLLCLPIMSSQKTSLGSIDWTALVVGFSSGYLNFYTEQSICLLSLKFCDEPVTGIKLQTQKNNSNARSQMHFASLVDELLITYRSSCAIVIDGIGLYENLRKSKDDVAKSGSGEYEPAYTLDNLPVILTCQKWNIVTPKGSRILDAELLGTRCTSRFDALRADSINFEHIPNKSCARTLALVGSDPFLTCCREAKNNTTHSYTDMISSLLPFWNKPKPTKFQMHEVSRSSDLCLFDRGRLATSIVASPDKRLAAITDDYGRVMLVDITNWIVIRIWKGYRSAQCGWVEVKRNPGEKGTPHALFLVIYAPKRGLLEVWSVQRGPRVAAFNVGKHCRLLYSGYKMLNMRAEASVKNSSNILVGSLVDQSYSTNCYLLNAKSETIFLIELPYTYSLYKYGHLKSRDHLLIGELTTAINHDAEISSISEILHRIALADSLQICINKIATELEPQKIIPIMENLIIKTMRNYDNNSGETLTSDDASIIDLSKRLIRLCEMFQKLSSKAAHHLELSLPEVNQRLIEQYEDHPKEVNEFAERLGWTAVEVLRCLSLLTLEQSYKKSSSKSSGSLFQYAHLGEPLSWSDFVSCFNLARHIPRASKSQATSGEITISLKELSSKYLNQDKVIKTALFLFVRLSENYHRSSMMSSTSVTDQSTIDLEYCYNGIEPSSRLAMLFQFWLSSKLCNHWKMWAFFQDQVGRISDELKVAVMAQDGDEKLLIDAWKRIYQLILESDNIFAAIIATTVIKSDTLRMLSDKEKRDKLERDTHANQEDEEVSSSAVDWECLCIDAERMSLLRQQSEDVFLLGLLLNYSHADMRIMERVFVYRVPRISVANIMRGGPTIVSELVSQWVAQMPRNENLDLTMFTQDYGDLSNAAEQPARVLIATERDSKPAMNRDNAPKFLPRLAVVASSDNKEDQVRELVHHVKTCFPHSLDRDVILLFCLWEFCYRWTSSALLAFHKSLLLQRAIDALSLISCPLLQHNASSIAFKTFFQRPFERLCLLVETNATIVSPKCLRSRDALARRELNMSEDCLEDFVRFCCNLSEFLLQTCRNEPELGTPASEPAKSFQDNEEFQTHQQQKQQQQQQQREQLAERLLCQDDWWSTPAATAGLPNEYHYSTTQDASLQVPISSSSSDYSGLSECISAMNGPNDKQLGSTMSCAQNLNSCTSNGGIGLVQATLSIEKLFSVNVLLELNRLASLMDLVFKLKIIKSYPLTLIGEESRQILKLDLQQSPTTGADIQLRSGSLLDLRQKFARRCIASIVAKLTDDLPSMASEFEDVDLTSGTAVSNQQSASLIGISESALTSSNSLFTRRRQQPSAAAAAKASGKKRMPASGGYDCTVDDDYKWNTANDTDLEQQQQQQQQRSQANNECLLLFANLLSLSNEWQLNRDELQLEFVFELFRCNHDKLAKQLIIRIQDKQMLASGLLKICSQRVLVLFGLSARLSTTNQWRQRVDKWSLFQPNISSWLKSVQEDELEHKLAELSFASPGDELKPAKGGGGGGCESYDDENCGQEQKELEEEEEEAFVRHIERALGLRMFVLKALHFRTKSLLELVTNYLDGQASRLAYDLLQLLEARLFERQFLQLERKLWLNERRANK